MGEGRGGGGERTAEEGINVCDGGGAEGGGADPSKWLRGREVGSN